MNATVRPTRECRTVDVISLQSGNNISLDCTTHRLKASRPTAIQKDLKRKQGEPNKANAISNASMTEFMKRE